MAYGLLTFVVTKGKVVEISYKVTTRHLNVNQLLHISLGENSFSEKKISSVKQVSMCCRVKQYI